MIEIKSVKTAADRRKFIEFPWAIYAGDRYWCPPLLIEERKMIDRKRHPFYLHGDAEFLLAFQDGKVVGRICVSIDPNANVANHEQSACFGMFESIDDHAVAQALFAAAEKWAQAGGMTKLRGPIDYSTNYPIGLLVDQFDHPQRILMKHNPPYYVGLIEANGFAHAMSLFSWWTDSSLKIDTWRKKVDRIVARSSVTVRPIDRRRLAEEIGGLRKLALTLMEGVWGYVKMTEAEFQQFAKDLDKVPAELFLIAEDKGDMVGMSITIPDYNEAIRPLNGRLTNWGLPIGLVKLLRGMRKIKTARVAFLGVKEEYRFEGIAERMILQTLEAIRSLGHTSTELGWTAESNYPMVRTADAVCGSKKRTFKIYEKPLAAAAL